MSTSSRTRHLFRGAAILALSAALAAPAAAIVATEQYPELCPECRLSFDPAPSDAPVASTYQPQGGSPEPTGGSGPSTSTARAASTPDASPRETATAPSIPAR